MKIPKMRTQRSQGDNFISCFIFLGIYTSKRYRMIRTRTNSSPFFDREHAALDNKNRQAGTDFLNMLYGNERANQMMQAWGPDFEWLTKDIVYGLFYADARVLGNLETELITYTSISCQNLHVPVKNHIEGLKRMGLGFDEAEKITECGAMAAKWGGHDIISWPDVGTLFPDWRSREPFQSCTSTRASSMQCIEPPCTLIPFCNFRNLHA